MNGKILKNLIQIFQKFYFKKIKERLDAKKKGDFKLADQIRDELLKRCNY